MSLSNTSEPRTWCFNLHTKASDGVEDVRGTFRHTLNPFTEQRKGCKPRQRAGNVGRASAQQPVLQTPLYWTPNFPAGNDNALPPSAALQMLRFQHLSSHFGALTCTLRLRRSHGMCNNVFNLTTAIRVGRLPRNSSVLQTLIGPLLPARGTTQVEKYRLPLLLVRCSAFQHLSSHFGALTCTQRFDGPRMCGHSDTHQSLYGTKKGCKPCQRASVEALP
ncbi:hypothetical protein TNIN_263481, partial [Trichonephila inaurata madagascariensis]